MKPLVIGHRGASGYRPENTLAAFELAFKQGADAIETDLVPTKDGYLILRHEGALSGTTDVAMHEHFAKRFRRGEVEGEKVKDWFSEDFTLAEIRELRAIERIPDWRPGSAKFDGQFEIPTVEDLLQAEWAAGKLLILELKNGDHFEELGLSLPQLLKAALDRVDWRGRGIRLMFESFDWHCLLEAKRLFADYGDFVFLVELLEPSDLETLLERTAVHFEGISVNLNALRIHDDLVDLAHARDLQVLTYTARVEQAENSVEEYYHNIVSTGVDGIFADQPDLLRNFVAGGL
ncbi:MAG: glycerophosphodiester phosphodiesterase family protein [Micrococcales bacterium]